MWHSKRWATGALIVALILCSTSDSWARYNTGAYRRYIQQQQKMQAQYLQMEQRAMMQAIAQQMAIEKHEAEMRAHASKMHHDKELQARQNLIAKRKAAQAQSASTKTDSK